MKFRHGYLSGNSTVSDVASDAFSWECELGLFSPSWDHRSECSCDAEFSVAHAFVVDFQFEDPFGYLASYRDRLLDNLRRQGSRVHLISHQIGGMESAWNQLWSGFKGVCREYGRPVRCFLDLSTCPRFLGLGLVAGALRLGLIYRFHISYAEGTYSVESDAHNPVDFPFSVGQWRNIPIPFLEGRSGPAKNKYFLVSVGFEGVKTARVLAREDPDRISLLYPIPGVVSEYDPEVLSRNRDTAERFRVPLTQRLDVAAGDAIGVWRAVSEAQLERPESEEVSFLCCGTKPHSLGLALRAIDTKYPRVLYNVPERHNYVETRPFGRYWRFEIVDESCPVAGL